MSIRQTFKEENGKILHIFWDQIQQRLSVTRPALACQHNMYKYTHLGADLTRQIWSIWSIWSIGPSSQKLSPNVILAGFTHCNNVNLQSGARADLWVYNAENLLWAALTQPRHCLKVGGGKSEQKLCWAKWHMIIINYIWLYIIIYDYIWLYIMIYNNI